MAEYIDREKIHYSKQTMEAWYGCQRDDYDAMVAFKDEIDKIPAADVRPVVLCRDCEQYCGRPWENNKTGICARTDCGVGEDDFCSYGEKQEES